MSAASAIGQCVPMPYIGLGKRTSARCWLRADATRTPVMTDTTTIKQQAPLTSGDFTAAEEPFALFAERFAEAVKSEPNDANAMALATVDAEGLTEVRGGLL